MSSPQGLQDQLTRLREELARLAERMDRLAAEIEGTGRDAAQDAAVPTPADGASSAAPLKEPSPAPDFAEPPVFAASTAGQVPPPLPASAGSQAAFQQAPAGVSSERTLPEPGASPSFRGKPTGEGVEMVVGKVWLVRLGVALLVVALVLFANFAYQHIVSNLGPLAKWVLLFAGAGALGLAGTWLQRSEPMQRFGQALEAGGLASGFYLLFAAHHIDGLQWIESALLTGVLLLAWSALMAWIADLRHSELLGGFSLLLAYIACVVTPVSGFGLFAVLALSAAAVSFLLKNGWKGVSLAALPATYGMFALWQIALPAVEGATPGATPELALACLLGYWGVFALAGFLADADSLGPQVRAALHLLNNSAVFLLGTTVLHRAHGGGDGFAWWASGLGMAWLALACAASRGDLVRYETSARVFLATGVVALTLALADLLDGTSLALALAVEAAALAAVSRFQWRKLYLGLAMVAGATGALIESVILLDDPSDAALGPVHGWAVALALVGAGWLARRRGEETYKVAFSAYWFSVLAVVVAQCLIAQTSDDAATMLGLMALGAAVALSLPLHRFRELAQVSLLPTASGCLSLLLLSHSERLGGWHCALAFVLVAAAGQAWLRLPGLGGSLPVGQAVLLLLAAAEGLALVMAGAKHDGSLPLQFAWAAAAFLMVAKARLTGSAWLAWLAYIPLVMAAVILADHAVFGYGQAWADAMVVVTAASFRPLGLRRTSLGCLPAADQRIWSVFSGFSRKAAPALAVLAAIAWSHACLPDERLTVAWSLGGAALLVFGMLSGQGIHRTWGLGVLALAGLRLVFVDIWALGPLARVVSFLVLGAVLVVAGFLYNRFGGRVRGMLTVNDEQK